MLPDFEDPSWNARREELETALGSAAKALLAHTGASGCTVDHEDLEVCVSRVDARTVNLTKKDIN